MIKYIAMAVLLAGCGQSVEIPVEKRVDPIKFSACISHALKHDTVCRKQEDALLFDACFAVHSNFCTASSESWEVK